MIRARLELPAALPGLADALQRAGVGTGGDAGLVFAPRDDAPATWDDVEAALLACFRASRAAADAGAPVVYLVSLPALLGRRGAEAGMLAGALVSAARALAMEGRKRGLRANVLTYDEHADADAVAGWARALLELPGASGDVIHLGSEHHGKVAM